jgi:hypothetical protein
MQDQGHEEQILILGKWVNRILGLSGICRLGWSTKASRGREVAARRYWDSDVFRRAGDDLWGQVGNVDALRLVLVGSRDDLARS